MGSSASSFTSVQPKEKTKQSFDVSRKKEARRTDAVGLLGYPNGTRKVLSWECMDDNFIGGSSVSRPKVLEHGGLCFQGELSTGHFVVFASTRAKINPALPANAKSIRIRFRADTRTYKVLLSNGQPTSPFSDNASWQHDLKTTAAKDEWVTVDLQLKNFVPNVGGHAEHSTRALKPAEQYQIGFMLSLKLSDGTPNPMELSDGGKVSFELNVASIDILLEDSANT